MRLGERLKAEGTHMVWLNTGGVQGRSSMAHGAALLEMLGLPYVGNDPLTAALLDDKLFFKRQLLALGIPTAPFVAWHPGRCPADPAESRHFGRVFRGWDTGFIVKPVSGRASLHVHYVETAAEIARVARDVFETTRDTLLIEGYLPGTEYCIAVTGPVIASRGRLEMARGPFAFAGVERLLDSDERVFTSMDVKPITKARIRPLDPVRDGVALEALEHLAQTLYGEFPLATLVRLDVRADDSGRLFVLEANPKPDLKAPDATATSIICAGLERHGMDYDDLVLSIFASRIGALLEEQGSSAERLLRLIEG